MEKEKVVAEAKGGTKDLPAELIAELQAIASEGEESPWMPLMSDPGLFSMLIKHFGVQGVEVGEVFDLNQPLPGPVYGYIQLSKYKEGNANVDVPAVAEEIDKNIFFAAQVQQNSCASYSVINIVMNNTDIKFGRLLSKVKKNEKYFVPDGSGHAFGFSDEIMQIHNRHSGYGDDDSGAEEDSQRVSNAIENSEIGDKVVNSVSSEAVSSAEENRAAGASNDVHVESCSDHASGAGIEDASHVVGVSNGVNGECCDDTNGEGVDDAFHFVSFVPINGHLFEMDSLKIRPIDHGTIPDETDWQTYCLRLLNDRVALENEQDSLVLMAIIPSQLDRLQEQHASYTSKRKQLMGVFQALVTAIDPNIFYQDMGIPRRRAKISDDEYMIAADILLNGKTETVISSSSASSKMETENAKRVDSNETSADNVAVSVPVVAENSDSLMEEFLSHLITAFEIRERKTPADATDAAEASVSNVSLKIVEINLASPNQETKLVKRSLKELLLCLRTFDEKIAALGPLIDAERAKWDKYKSKYENGLGNDLKAGSSKKRPRKAASKRQKKAKPKKGGSHETEDKEKRNKKKRKLSK